MKRIYYLFMVLFTLFIKIFENEIPIITNELKLNHISYLTLNLYDDISVSNILIDVYDYNVYDNKLYIYPINNEVILPISGIVNKISKNYIIISDFNDEYKISNIKKNVYLYQYYNEYTNLGIVEDYYIIESKSINKIVSKLNLNNEEI